jgi:hypothetical protein
LLSANKSLTEENADSTAAENLRPSSLIACVRIDIERRGGGSVTQARLRILHRRAAVDEKAAVQVAWAVKAEVFHVGRVLRGMENRVQLIRIKRSTDFILEYKLRARLVLAQIHEQASKVRGHFDCPSRSAELQSQ